MASGIAHRAPRQTDASITRRPRGLSAVATGLVLLLLVLTAAAIAIAITMANNDSIEKETLWYEIGKLVAQAGILTGFGALLTLLVHEFQQDQEASRKRVTEDSQRLADRHAWFRDLAGRLTDAYGDVKQSRRRLQWASVTDSSTKYVSTSVYEKQLRRLGVIQAEFESLLTLAETYLPDGDAADTIKTSLKRIDTRLSGLISERKKSPPTVAERNSRVSLETREVMRAFLADSDERHTFKGPYGFNGVRECYMGILKGVLEELRPPDKGSAAHRRSWRRPWISSGADTP